VAHHCINNDNRGESNGSSVGAFLWCQFDAKYLALILQSHKISFALVQSGRGYNNEIIQVVVDAPHTPPVHTPLQGIGYSSEYLWCQAQPKWEHGIDIVHPFPHDSQQWAVIWVDWHQTIGQFNVDLGQECSWA